MAKQIFGIGGIDANAEVVDNIIAQCVVELAGL